MLRQLAVIIRQYPVSAGAMWLICWQRWVSVACFCSSNVYISFKPPMKTPTSCWW